MKIKNKIKSLSLFFLIMMSLTSCEDFFSDDNSDPQGPVSVPIEGIIPAVELTIVDAQGGMFSLMNNMFVQQVEGVERQWESFNKYDIQPVRYNAIWNQIYENVIIELKTVNKIATDNGYNHILAVSKVLEAYTYLVTTDVFGDIPFTEAGLGDENLNPVYDDQATVVYPGIKTLLTDALTLLDGPSGDVGANSMGDLFYGGNVDSWKKAIHAILARYYLHLGDNANALAEAKQSFTSRDDNLSYKYPGGLNADQWFGFNDVRQGDMEFHPTMRAIMTGLNDTDRLAKFDQTFNADHPYLVDDYDRQLISYREIQFIIAETSTDPTEKRDAYINGIKAAFEEVGLTDVEADAYLMQAAIDPGVGNITLENIMTQKYIAMFVQAEAFSDWRRTGIPALTPVAGTQIPRRWFYPENEYLFNENAPARDSDLLFKRVDWDN